MITTVYALVFFDVETGEFTNIEAIFKTKEDANLYVLHHIEDYKDYNFTVYAVKMIV